MEYAEKNPRRTEEINQLRELSQTPDLAQVFQ